MPDPASVTCAAEPCTADECCTVDPPASGSGSGIILLQDQDQDQDQDLLPGLVQDQGLVQDLIQV